MPRSNRPRRRAGRPGPDDDGDAFEGLRQGLRRSETRRGIAWTVQPIRAGRSEKAYTCPSCGRAIAAGLEHVVAWRADGVLGEDAALADRRHWHAACWRIGG